MALKNPNGYGSVVKLSGKRRKPYAVRKTIDYDDRAYPIYAVLGYYETRKEAMMALANYNANPYDLRLAKSSFAQLYGKWSTLSFPAMSASLVAAHKAAFKHCSKLYDRPYREIRAHEMQSCINECGKSYATQTNIKNLFSQLDKFAFDNDVIAKCYSTNLTVQSKDVQTKREVFTDSEVETLWAHQGELCIDETLFMLYTGCRVNEMLTLTCDRIDVESGIITHGIKTAAGRDRIIPIHSKLLPIVEERLNDSLLFIDWGDYEKEKTRYTVFFRKWQAVLNSLGMNHIPHECRHTFRTKLDSAGANKVCIDLIMGHKTSDVGERVYTHKTIEDLKSAIEKLSYSP